MTDQYPEGVTERMHIAYDMKRGIFPSRSSVRDFLEHLAFEASTAIRLKMTARELAQLGLPSSWANRPLTITVDETA